MFAFPVRDERSECGKPLLAALQQGCVVSESASSWLLTPLTSASRRDIKGEALG